MEETRKCLFCKREYQGEPKDYEFCDECVDSLEKIENKVLPLLFKDLNKVIITDVVERVFKKDLTR